MCQYEFAVWVLLYRGTVHNKVTVLPVKSVLFYEYFFLLFYHMIRCDFPRSRCKTIIQLLCSDFWIAK